MIKYTRIEQPDTLQQMRDDYLHTLIAPMDGMWENTEIAHAAFWEIQDQGQPVGHFCLDSNNYLLRFHLLESYQVQALEIFHKVISTNQIHHAIAGTMEPLYFPLCLAMQKSSEIHTHLFRDNTRIESPFKHSNLIFRKAEKGDLAVISRFYHANTEGSGEWIDAFLDQHLNQEDLFVLYDQQALVATGECIPSRRQIPYADLGMIVARPHRGRGLGSSMLVQLKQCCYDEDWEPICSCAGDNHASKKAIEKAGFINANNMLKIHF